MSSYDLTPARLAIRLMLYFVILFGATAMVITTWPDTIQSLPLGGHDALDSVDLPHVGRGSSGSTDDDGGGFEITSTLHQRTGSVKASAWFLSLHLTGTILLMIPITWTYMATRQDTGYQKNFPRALIVLPICASTIVLLIQDSLALAFGLAALVAAVRFRVSLDDAVDGIFVFAAICVGLAAGIGYLGIAGVMTIFFCFATLVLWQIKYGENPLDQVRQERKRAKIANPDEASSR